VSRGPRAASSSSSGTVSVCPTPHVFWPSACPVRKSLIKETARLSLCRAACFFPAAGRRPEKSARAKSAQGGPTITLAIEFGLVVPDIKNPIHSFQICRRSPRAISRSVRPSPLGLPDGSGPAHAGRPPSRKLGPGATSGLVSRWWGSPPQTYPQAAGQLLPGSCRRKRAFAKSRGVIFVVVNWFG